MNNEKVKLRRKTVTSVEIRKQASTSVAYLSINDATNMKETGETDVDLKLVVIATQLEDDKSISKAAVRGRWVAQVDCYR